MNTQNIGFIGAGNMALAMIKALLNKGWTTKQIYVNDVDEVLLQQRQSTLGVVIIKELRLLINQCDIVILAVKPNQIQTVCENISTVLPQDNLPLFVSVAAGINTHNITKWLGLKTAVIRLMPNSPAMISCGATGVFANVLVSITQRQIIQNLLSGMGLSVWVESEDKIDAITALSGSGPAYFFYMIEAITQGGIALGLDAPDAYKLAVQTAKGGAMMAEKHAKTLDDCIKLRQQVTSPNGTTQAAIEALDNLEINKGVQAAMQAAYNRAKILGK